MNARPIDVQRTLEYTSKVLPRGNLWIPALLLVACVLILAGDPPRILRIGPWLGILIGAGWLLFATIRRVIPARPMLVLSPRGMIWRNLSGNLIPWDVIQDITATNHVVSSRRALVTYSDVSVVWVPRQFYNRKIFIQSLFRRGPFSAKNFIHKDALTGIIVLHDLLAVKPKPLREEIVARWQAFRESSQASPIPRTIIRGPETTAPRHRDVPAGEKVGAGAFVKWAMLGLLLALTGSALYFLVTSMKPSPDDSALARLEQTRASLAAREAEDRKRREREAEDRQRREREEAAQRRAREEARSTPPVAKEPAKGHLKIVTALAPVDGSNFLSAGGDGAIKLWDGGAARVLRDVGLHQDGMFPDYVRAMHVLPGGAHVLSADDKGKIALRELGDDKVLHLFDASKHGDLSALAVSADGRHALSVHPRGSLIVWDVEARKQVKNLSNVGMQTAALSADGRLAITGGYDGALWLWDVRAGTMLRSLGGHSCCAQSVLFMPGDRYAISGGGDSTLRMWDVASGNEVRSFPGHTGLITSLAVSADGKYIVSGSIDNTARLWDAETGAELSRQDAGSRVYAVAIAADGTILMGGDERGAIKSWRPLALRR